MTKSGLMGVLWLVTILVIAYFFPWKNISWGKITLATDRTVTVTGYAESKVANQIANFSAGVTALNDVKETAVNEVNKKMTDLIAAVKGMGVADSDIQTSQLSVYQMQERVVTTGVKMMPIDGGKVKLGQWSASNTIQITLRNVDKASELADLLAKSGANNVYGPNFSLDTSNKAADALLGAAIQDARTKALAIAVAGGAKLGNMITVSEGGVSNQIFPMMAKGSLDSAAPAPVEVGSTNVSKTVTVVWGLE